MRSHPDGRKGMGQGMPDDGGFFGPNRLYYWWLMSRYKAGGKLEKLQYWMFQKDMKIAQSLRRKDGSR
jgi:hypothetical protein